MKRVLVTFAGSRIALGFCRALMQAPEPIYLLGVDSDPWKLQRAATHQKALIPTAREPQFIDVLAQIVREYEIDLVWPNHEAEIAALAGREEEIGASLFLPDLNTIKFCQDKMASYGLFASAGIPTPKSRLIETKADIERAFLEFGPNLWVRAIKGTGGNGSMPVSDMTVACQWLDLNRGWGRFMAAPQLSKRTVTWESVWDRGQLVFAQGRQRLYWEFGSLTFSGVTGIGGAHRWVDDPVIDQIGENAVRAITEKPHGVFSADVTFGHDASPYLTEINGGRFMSGGVIHWTQDQFNVPFIALKVALGETLPIEPPVRNPFRTDGVLIHGMDVEPVRTSVAAVERHIDELAMRRERTNGHLDPHALSNVQAS